MASIKPVVGHWYDNLEDGQTFKVITIDNNSEKISVQYLDNEIDEMNMQSWLKTSVVEITPPTDWASSIEDFEPDDFGETELSSGLGEWSPPMDVSDE